MELYSGISRTGLRVKLLIDAHMQPSSCRIQAPAYPTESCSALRAGLPSERGRGMVPSWERRSCEQEHLGSVDCNQGPAQQ